MNDEARDEEEYEVLDHVRYILEHSSQGVVNVRHSKDRGLPLWLAMGGWLLGAKPWLAAVKLLLEAGGDPNTKESFTSYRQEIEVSKRPSECHYGFSPTWILHHAVREDRSDGALVNLLLDHGARPDNKDPLGRTAYQLKNSIRHPRLARTETTDGAEVEEATTS